VHKCIESIIAELQSQDFARLRVGIGRPDETEGSTETSEADIIAYVLSDFTPGEKPEISQVIPEVSEAILCFLTEGIAMAMSRYN
jgi:PTH1 family peptidyl-tRNA hydrolase